ncbi:MAG: hypothetical protein ABIN74_10150 [Ferruginibacter sp.]
MLNPIRIFLTGLSLLFFLIAFTGCDMGEKEVKAEYNAYTFDQQLIDKLPLYDSLVSAIIQNYPAFGKFIRDENGHRTFLYIPASQDPDVFIKLPPQAAPKVSPYFDRPGKDFIYGFEIFKDSSIRIMARTRFSERSKVDIDEFLSYYPRGNIKRREFPDKDTLLNTNWQYRARFNKRGAF